MLAPKYDRIAPLVGLVIMGLGVALLLESRMENLLLVPLIGDLPALSVSWAIVAALVVLVSTGADLLARGHPEMQHRTLPVIRLGPLAFEVAPRFWILPSLVVIGAFAFARLFRNEGAFLPILLSLVAVAGLLVAVLAGQHYSLDRNAHLRERWLTALQAVAYLTAFTLFSAIYAGLLRSLYGATLVALCAALLSYVLLARERARHARMLSLLIGLAMAEMTWALNYWGASFLMGGTLLLALFYAMLGMLQHYQMGTLNRRIVWEFASLGGVVLAIMAAALLVFQQG